MAVRMDSKVSVHIAITQLEQIFSHISTFNFTKRVGTSIRPPTRVRVSSCGIPHVVKVTVWICAHTFRGLWVERPGLSPQPSLVAHPGIRVSVNVKHR